MNEVFPVLAGIALGLATASLAPTWLRAAAIGILGIAFGTVATWLSGELAVSRLYILVDTAQVIATAILCAVLLGGWLRRRARSAAF